MSNAKWEDISQIVSPLSLGIKRAKALIRFSQEYISLTQQSDAFNLEKDQVMVSTLPLFASIFYEYTAKLFLSSLSIQGLYNIGEYGWTGKSSLVLFYELCLYEVLHLCYSLLWPSFAYLIVFMQHIYMY